MIPRPRPCALTLTALIGLAGVTRAGTTSGDARRTAPRADPGVLVERLLEVSGMDSMIEGIPDAVASQHASGLAGLDPGFVSLYERVSREAYDVERLRAAIVGYLERHRDEEMMKAAIALHEKDLVERMVAWEIEGSGPEMIEALPAYAETLQSSPPSPERVALMRRIDELAGSTDMQIEIFTATLWSMIRATQMVLPEANRATAAQMEAKIVQVREQMAPAMSQQIHVAMLYIYREATVDELETYADLLETQQGIWWVHSAASAMKDAMAQAGDRLAELFVKGLQERSRREADR